MGIICMLIRGPSIMKVFVLCYKYCYYGHIISEYVGVLELVLITPMIALIISIVS